MKGRTYNLPLKEHPTTMGIDIRAVRRSTIIHLTILPHGTNSGDPILLVDRAKLLVSHNSDASAPLYSARLLEPSSNEKMTPTVPHFEQGHTTLMKTKRSILRTMTTILATRRTRKASTKDRTLPTGLKKHLTSKTTILNLPTPTTTWTTRRPMYQ